MAGLRLARFVHALVHQPDADDLVFLDQRLRHGRAGPDLHHPRAHDLLPYPLDELADGENQPALLVQEVRGVGKLQREVLKTQEPDRLVRQAQRGRPPAGRRRASRGR